MVKNHPAMQETQVWSQGRKDPLEKEITTHSSFLPGKSHGQRSLAGYSPWDHKESDMTEQLTFSHTIINEWTVRVRGGRTCEGCISWILREKLFMCFQFSHSVMSNSTQHTRPPCPSPAPRVDPNSCPLSRWCHPTIPSSVVHFSSCLQSFLVLESFQMSQLFSSGGQSIGVSASTSVLPMNTQDWSPLGRTGWFSLQSKGLSRVFSNTTTGQKHQFSALSFLYSPTLTFIHNYWENHSLD